MSKHTGAQLPRPVRRARRTTLITVGLVGVLCGIGLARFGLRVDMAAVLILCTLSAPVLYRKQLVVSVALVAICGGLVGLWRGGQTYQAMMPYERLYGRSVTIMAVANEDAVYGKNSQLSFDVGSIQIEQPYHVRVPGRVKAQGFGEYMVYKGDVLRIQGKLYQTRGGRQGQMSFASFKVVQHGSGWADSVRRRFAAGMQNALPEPLASFGLGLLIGQRSTIPADVSQQLATVGLTHLVAVSGYNLTIIVDAVRRLSAKRSKYQSFMLSVVFIGLFLMLTGLSASIVRAAIVSMLSLLAWYYGRRIKPLLLISLAAALTALWNPLYVWSDIGWYLSFLAFFGVVVVAPAITQRIYGDREPGILHAVFIETSAAQLMTLPYILYVFQQVSVISLLSNVVVVPLVPLAMLLSVIAGTAGMYIAAVAGWLAWPARILLTYMLDCAALFSRAPHALLHGGLTIPGLVICYMIIGFVTVILVRRGGQKVQNRV